MDILPLGIQAGENHRRSSLAHKKADWTTNEADTVGKAESGDVDCIEDLRGSINFGSSAATRSWQYAASLRHMLYSGQAGDSWTLPQPPTLPSSACDRGRRAQLLCYNNDGVYIAVRTVPTFRRSRGTTAYQSSINTTRPVTTLPTDICTFRSRSHL